jgi:hypothetical protein
MNELDEETRLQNALAAFETSVTTPVVSGELAEWAERASKTWAEASAQIERHTRELHPRQYEDMTNADAGLFQQTELLRAEDEALAQQREKLDRTLTRVAKHIPDLEPDEVKAAPFVESLVEEAIGYVGRVRKQEVAVQTWFAEAFNRERGGGD